MEPARPDLARIRQHLLDAGVPESRLLEAAGADELRGALAEHRLLGEGPRSSLAEVAGELGVELGMMAEVLGLMGVDIADFAAAVISDAERQVLEAFSAAAQLFGDEAILRFTCVLATSLGRVAEAGVSMFGVRVQDPLVAAGGDEVELTEAVDEALLRMSVIPDVLTSVFRRQALNAIRRLGAAHVGLPDHDQAQLTVAFADLVGSTPWLQARRPGELTAALGEFERLALRSLRGEARLVKMIGDEVMYVTIDAADGCRTAIALAEAVGADATLPEVRAGLACGLIAAHDGDFYGAEVNRAARLVHIAEPGSVVVSAAVATAAADAPDLRFSPLEPAMLAGFDGPVDVAVVARA